jgi:hypothetical protein
MAVDRIRSIQNGVLERLFCGDYSPLSQRSAHRSGERLFQAAKRKAGGYTRFQTVKTVIFLIAGRLDLAAINPHSLNPIDIQKPQRAYISLFAAGN